MKTKTPKPKGFAAMPHKDVMRICTMGGLAVSRNRKHMAALGRIGGTAKHRNARKAKMARKDSND